MSSKEELAKLTVADLKAALKDAGLPITGKKDELVDRLFTAKTTAPAEPPAAEAPATKPAQDATPSEPSAAEAFVAAAGAAAAGAAADASGKHAKIVFSEDSVKAAPSKVTVINQAPKEAPAAAPAAAAATGTTAVYADKLKNRSERFKDPEVERLKQRAQRFGVSHPELEKEKAVKRAERFGTFHPEIEQDKKKQRAERFGIVDPVAKAAARAERFKPLPKTATTGASLGMSQDDFDERKKARAARFAAAT